MKCFFSFFLLAVIFCGYYPAYSQETKLDTIVQSGKVGYKVFCKNKNDEENRLEIKLLGFENTARPPNFFIRGRVASAQIDDLNNDGYPDLVLFIYAGAGGVFGTVYAFVSEQNKSLIPLALPDVSADGKLNVGYKGHDEFSMLEGSILQKFPVYKPGDDKDKPTGGKRIIQYQMVPDGNGKYKFKVMQSYDLK
jgi:hypothetical protein